MPDWPSEEDALGRIEPLVDDGILLAVGRTGESDHYWYYLTLIVKEYSGNEYLNERYVQLVKEPSDEYDDTFKKNGINRRIPEGVRADQLAQSLVRIYSNAKVDIEAAMYDPDSSVLGDLPRYSEVA